MSKIFCPSCQQLLEHERGYLPLHMTDVQRGALVTGSKVCDLSNKKVVTELGEMRFEHDCADCGMKTELTLTEEYPGAFDKRVGFIEMDCIGCSTDHDGYWCEHCGREVKQHADEWHITDPGEQEVKVVYSQADADAHVLAWQTANPAAQVAGTLGAQMPITNPQQAMQAAMAIVGLANEPLVEHHGPGWYDLRGDGYCDGRDPTLGEEHSGVFKAELHKKVLLVDTGNIIEEEPDLTREEEEAIHG